MLKKFEVKWTIKKPIIWSGLDTVEATDERYAEYLVREKVARRFKIGMAQVTILK